MHYKHISGKIYEVTVLGRTIMVDYDGSSPQRDLESIAVDRILNHEHTDCDAPIRQGLFNTSTGTDEETM